MINDADKYSHVHYFYYKLWIANHRERLSGCVDTATRVFINHLDTNIFKYIILNFLFTLIIKKYQTLCRYYCVDTRSCFQTLKQMKSKNANNLRKTNAIDFLEISAAARFEKSYTFGACIFIFFWGIMKNNFCSDRLQVSIV